LKGEFSEDDLWKILNDHTLYCTEHKDKVLGLMSEIFYCKNTEISPELRELREKLFEFAKESGLIKDNG